MASFDVTKLQWVKPLLVDVISGVHNIPFHNPQQTHNVINTQLLRQNVVLT